MTSSATARARARRQARSSVAASARRSSSRFDGSAERIPDYDDAIPVAIPTHHRESGAHLRVVPQPVRRRSGVSRASLVVFGLATFTIGVIVFQATIAEQQLRLDALTTDLRLAESHYDNLRQERAELLSPGRLREEATMMGMYQGLSTKFVEVPADVVAEVMASTARMNPLFADPPAGVATNGALAQAQRLEVVGTP